MRSPLPRTGRVGWRRPLGAAALVAALAAPGCTVISVRYGGPVPDDGALAGVVPGTSTEADALAALGVPEEYAGPHPLAFGRAWDPPRERVLEERDLVDRRVLTWLRERRVSREFAVLPRLPLLGDLLTFFSYQVVTHRGDRVVVLLDERGLVTAVGRTRGGDA